MLGIPLFAVYLAVVSDELPFTSATLWVLTAASVLATRFWVKFGEADTPDFAVYSSYLGTHGPWMETRDYLVYGLLCVLTGVALFATMRRSTSQTRAAGP
jgi:hypothetical protein